MKVLMLPTLKQFEGEESGIKRVVEAYHRYSKKFGIEFVDCQIEDEDRYDLYVVHAGTSNRYPKRKPIISAIHGLYWTADYNSAQWEWKTNAAVIESLRIATVVTAPSDWVREVVARDMRINAYVVPHGVDHSEWVHNRKHAGYVLWNKNRASDVCSPEPMVALAKMSPSTRFISTFATSNSPGNIEATGVVGHSRMVKLVQDAAVYLSTTKETFGIGVLEALAAGTPVLGFRYGGNATLVEHGVTGYLADPGNYEDLKRGLDYCLKYRDQLSVNARLRAAVWTWENSMACLKNAFDTAVERWNDDQLPLYIDSSEYKRGENE